MGSSRCRVFNARFPSMRQRDFLPLLQQRFGFGRGVRIPDFPESTSAMQSRCSASEMRVSVKSRSMSAKASMSRRVHPRDASRHDAPVTNAVGEKFLQRNWTKPKIINKRSDHATPIDRFCCRRSNGTEHGIAAKRRFFPVLQALWLDEIVQRRRTSTHRHTVALAEPVDGKLRRAVRKRWRCGHIPQRRGAHDKPRQG